jgi:hypothetical protein
LAIGYLFEQCLKKLTVNEKVLFLHVNNWGISDISVIENISIAKVLSVLAKSYINMRSLSKALVNDKRGQAFNLSPFQFRLESVTDVYLMVYSTGGAFIISSLPSER